MKHRNLFRFSIIVAIIALVTMACQLPFMPSTSDDGEREIPEKEAEDSTEIVPETDAEKTEEPGEGGILWGDAVLDGVASTAEGFTAGEIIKVKVHNPSDKPTTVTIPCGLVFNPPEGSGEQKLMVIQAVVEEIPAGGTAELQPYVVCIESSAHAPGEGSAYQVGPMAEEAGLLRLADCLCKEKLNPDITAFQEILGVQFATWMVAGDMDLDELTSNPGEGASGEMMEAFGSDDGYVHQARPAVAG